MSSGLIPVELLGFADATVSEFRVDGVEPAASLDQLSGSLRGSSVSVPGANADGAHILALRYRVERALEASGGVLRARIPVLSVGLPPIDGSSDVFRAEVRVPAEWAVSEGFPTALRRDGEGIYRVSLPVVPAMVSLRARTDGAWRPGVPLALDVLAVIIILGFGYRGWRHLREVAA